MFDGPSTSDLDPAERRARLRLARSARIGPVTFHEALQHFGSARRGLPRAAGGRRSRDRARGTGAGARLGGRFLVLGDADYPAALAALPDAPPVLSAIGDLGLLAPARPWRSSARARPRSPAGASPPIWPARLGPAGFVVASGLARGIDAAAHEAALPTGTVAVLAGGIDQVYPPQNAGLQRAIAERGLLLAETPLGHAAGRPLLPAPQPHRQRPVGRGRRDRGGRALGLPDHRPAGRSSRAARSSSCPGSPMDPRYAGSNTLIRDGAILARDANDIISVFGKPQSAPPSR